MGILPTRVGPRGALSKVMFELSIVALVLVSVACIFGFGGVAATAMGVAKILFAGLLVLTVAGFLWSYRREQRDEVE